MATRVAVFIDYQNVYMRAREFYGLPGSDFTLGQIYPRRLGLLLTDRGRAKDADRQLEVVRVYRGEPSGNHSPQGQAACQRQVRYWSSQAAVEPITRPLRYYRTGQQDGRGSDIYEAREKGIDVLIAIDMVMGAVTNAYEVCVLFSADTDLVPAIEEVRRNGKRIEVASWRPRQAYGSCLKPSGGCWCHWLTETDFAWLSDPTDYTRPVPELP
jgi:uncharacterized LabA/DUF88 family protein